MIIKRNTRRKIIKSLINLNKYWEREASNDQEIPNDLKGIIYIRVDSSAVQLQF